MATLIKRSSAFFPIAMSMAALVLVLGHIVLFSAARQTDEGSAAHIFQILIAVQVPVIALFVIRWLPQAPRQAVQIVALQILAALIAFAPVFYFNL